MPGISQLREDVAFLVDHERFSPDRAYRALALCDSDTYGDPEYLFINELGESIFVKTTWCRAIEPDTYSMSWPSPYRRRREPS